MKTFSGVWCDALMSIDLPNGYRVRFEADADLLVTIGRVVEIEHQCCRFLTFELTIEPGGAYLAAVHWPAWNERISRGHARFLSACLSAMNDPDEVAIATDADSGLARSKSTYFHPGDYS